MLRKWVYKDHYHANLTVEEEQHMISHVGKIYVPYTSPSALVFTFQCLHRD